MAALKRCVSCHKEREKMKFCSRCKTAFYCSVNCQREDREKHNVECRPNPDSDEHPLQSSDQNGPKTCLVCERATTRCCSGCKSVLYCSVDCQKENWKDHKVNCKPKSTSTLVAVKQSEWSDRGGPKTCVVCKRATKRCCSGCKSVLYCSVDCQKEDWKEHKVSCKPGSTSTLVAVKQSESAYQGEPQTCVVCKRATTRCCSGCKSVLYCSVDCQQEDWKEHRILCKAEPISDKNPYDSKLQPCEVCTLLTVIRCGKCKAVSYCSPECQRKDIQNHRGICNVMKEFRDRMSVVFKDFPKSRPRSYDAENPGKVVSMTMASCDMLTGRMQTAEDVKRHNDYILGRIKLPPPSSFVPGELELLRDAIVERTPECFYTPMTGTSLIFILDFSQVKSELEWDLNPAVTENTVLLAKILKLDDFQDRRGVRIIDKDNLNVPMYFHIQGSPCPFFNWDHLVPGNFVCIRGAKLHRFLDGQTGFRVDHASTVCILTPSGENPSVSHRSHFKE